MDLNSILFYLLIFATHIIQGITGFAGTILAMPTGIFLVGYDIARPILNMLGLLAGLYVFIPNYKMVNLSQLKKIIVLMLVGMLVGFIIKGRLVEQQSLIFKTFGLFVIILAGLGFYRIKHKKTSLTPVWQDILILLVAGVVHALFVSSGPILVSYMAKKNQDAGSFRATLSSLWIVLNGIILLQDIVSVVYNRQLIVSSIISIPFWFVGMLVGSYCFYRMKQSIFIKITYLLLLISGITILIK